MKGLDVPNGNLSASFIRQATNTEREIPTGVTSPARKLSQSYIPSSDAAADVPRILHFSVLEPSQHVPSSSITR